MADCLTKVSVCRSAVILGILTITVLEAFIIIIHRDDFEHLNYEDLGKDTHLNWCLLNHNENENKLRAITMINHPNIDLSIENGITGQTALEFAREEGLDDIVELIESKINA